jgi:hypothetical protein
MSSPAECACAPTNLHWWIDAKYLATYVDLRAGLRHVMRQTNNNDLIVKCAFTASHAN